MLASKEPCEKNPCFVFRAKRKSSCETNLSLKKWNERFLKSGFCFFLIESKTVNKIMTLQHAIYEHMLVQMMAYL